MNSLRTNDCRHGPRKHHIIESGSQYYDYDPRGVHELCRMGMQDESIQSVVAEKLAETELRVVLAHTLHRAGFDCSVKEILSISQ